MNEYRTGVVVLDVMAVQEDLRELEGPLEVEVDVLPFERFRKDKLLPVPGVNTTNITTNCNFIHKFYFFNWFFTFIGHCNKSAC